MSLHTHDSELIDRLGGTAKVAQLCDLTSGAVSQWRTNGIPKAWKLFFRLRSPRLYRAWEAEQAAQDRTEAA